MGVGSGMVVVVLFNVRRYVLTCQLSSFISTVPLGTLDSAILHHFQSDHDPGLGSQGQRIARSIDQ